MPKRRLALTMGDPAGIGPEIIAKTCARLKGRLAAGELSLLVIGSAASLRPHENISGPIPPMGTNARSSPVAILDVDDGSAPVPLGVVSARAGRLAYLAIERAVQLALAGEVDGLVTAPLNKEALNLAGYAYSGHTEMLADLTGARDSVMMLAHGHFRVSHVSTHIPLAQVPSRLTKPRLERVIALTAETLRQLGIARPRIAVAALNPHAGEGGIFGREDLDVTAPVVASYASAAFDVTGPVPGDTVFVKLLAKQYDAVVAMYHDQGHVPVKLLGFNVDPETGVWKALSGVNVTLGLPIIRTSVDHGTAFDIAGKGIASADSFVEAVDFALQLAAAGSATPDLAGGGGRARAAV
jgi:4-hydroxythreonine-4-phosphate dehydrogenase